MLIPEFPGNSNEVDQVCMDHLLAGSVTTVTHPSPSIPSPAGGHPGSGSDPGGPDAVGVSHGRESSADDSEGCTWGFGRETQPALHLLCSPPH